MMDQIPLWLDILFISTALLTLIFFYIFHNRPKKIIFMLVVWCIIQSCIAASGYYLNTESLPPRFVFVLAPAFLFIGFGLLPRSLKWIDENRNRRSITFIHTVRIPVEIVLFYLYSYGTLPELMTFAGRNFDIIAGITALFVGGYFIKGKLHPMFLFSWNLIFLGFVLFIMINGILSAPYAFQQFAFDHPNVAVLSFPYILLPALIVPLVIYVHITEIIFWAKK